jgi:peptidoglycan hydrolase-like protein with peptidoglycan-binding domain
VVYGINDYIKEEVYLPGYNISESLVKECTYKSVKSNPVVSTPTINNTTKLTYTLQLGSSGYEVQKLQKELKMLSYFRTDVTGYFGPVTEHSIFKFQQSQGIVENKESQGAGIFGPKTKKRLNEIISSREYTHKLVAEATSSKNNKILVNKKQNSKIASSE